MRSQRRLEARCVDVLALDQRDAVEMGQFMVA
jgi:hypothetical protein